MQGMMQGKWVELGYNEIQGNEVPDMNDVKYVQERAISQGEKCQDFFFFRKKYQDFITQIPISHAKNHRQSVQTLD